MTGIVPTVLLEPRTRNTRRMPLFTHGYTIIRVCTSQQLVRYPRRPACGR